MNPNQKAGNFKRRRGYRPTKKGDKRIQRIARMEAKKVVATKIESKTTDRFSTAFNIDNTFSTSVFDMTGNLTQGTSGANSYLGQVIEPTHLRIKWSVRLGDELQLLRVMVIQDISGGGFPTASTLLQYTGVNSPISPLGISYKHTYRVLFDEFYTMVGGTESNLLSGDITIRKNKLNKVSFVQGGGSLTADGAIYLIFVSDSSAVTPPIGQYVSRLYFKDA